MRLLVCVLIRPCVAESGSPSKRKCQYTDFLYQNRECRLASGAPWWPNRKFAVKLVYNQAVSYRYAQATAPDPVVMRRIARHIDRDAAAVVDKIRQPG